MTKLTLKEAQAICRVLGHTLRSGGGQGLFIFPTGTRSAETQIMVLDYQDAVRTAWGNYHNAILLSGPNAGAIAAYYAFAFRDAIRAWGLG